MATPVMERPDRSRDPWGSAPVASGRHRNRSGWVVLLLLLAAVVAVVLLLARTTPSAPVAPAPEPGEQAAPPPVASTTFDVTVEVTRVSAMDNDTLYGGQAIVPQDAVQVAAQRVGETLQRYLDAQFVTPETRFTEAPAVELLGARAAEAASRADLAGLGVVDVAVERVEAEPVTIKLHVLTSGSDAVLASARYQARALVTTADGEQVPMRQRATMVLVADGDQWRVDAVEADLDLPLPAGEVAR